MLGTRLAVAAGLFVLTTATAGCATPADSAGDQASGGGGPAPSLTLSPTLSTPSVPPTADGGDTGDVEERMRGYDWKTISYQAGDCPPSEGGNDDWATYAVGPTAADLTHDGSQEVVLSFSCTHLTAGWPQKLLVFDLTTEEPTFLADLAAEYFFGEDLTWSVDGTTVTVQGSTKGPDDPGCCKSFNGKATYEWDGSRFALLDASQEPK